MPAKCEPTQRFLLAIENAERPSSFYFWIVTSFSLTSPSRHWIQPWRHLAWMFLGYKGKTFFLLGFFFSLSLSLVNQWALSVLASPSIQKQRLSSLGHVISLLFIAIENRIMFQVRYHQVIKYNQPVSPWKQERLIKVHGPFVAE